MIYETAYALGVLAMVLIMSAMAGYEIRIVQEYRAKERRRKRKDFHQSFAECNCRHEIKPIYEFTVGKEYVPYDRFRAYSGAQYIKKEARKCQEKDSDKCGR